MKKGKIGIVGCGAIVDIYLSNLNNMFKNTEIIGVCDLIDERASRVVSKYPHFKKYKDMHELFADDNIEFVLNLTRPYEHMEVSLAAIKAGKHLYSEKPLGASFEEGKRVKDAALEKGVLVGGAPDTFLGAGIQTCIKLIKDGYIGKPLSATAFLACRGHETWHPDPEFYYKYGGGPMMDMGPYYITALVNLIGEVESVTGMTTKGFEKRLITSKPHNGTIIDVDVPTHITGSILFKNGAIASIITSFDIYAHSLPIIEIYGTDGSIQVPDPNNFSGPIRVYRPETGKFMEMPLLFGYPDNSRGLGLSEMIDASHNNREPKAGLKLTYHVLDIMTGFTRASETGKQIKMELV